MNADNPYAPPEADLAPRVEVGAGSDLAGRPTRLGAQLVDGLIAMPLSVGVLYASGGLESFGQGEPLPLGLLVAVAAINIGLFLLIHGYFLKTNGQTIGKKWAGIRIATLDGGVPDFGKVVALRYLPIWVIANIPAVGPLLSVIDVLFIFRHDRRCLHDLIAGTKVVVVEKRG